MGKKTDKLKDGLKNLKNKEIIIAAIAVAIMLIVYFVGGSGRTRRRAAIIGRKPKQSCATP